MEQGIQSMAQNYTVQMCPIHPEEQLNTICIDPTCISFFQPACYECSREQHNHLIQSMIKIKSCFNLLAENAKEGQYAQLESTDEQIQSHIENISKEYRLIGEKCTQIADNLKKEAIEMARIEDPLYYKCKVSNFLGVIFENQQSIEALKKTLEQLKNVLEFSGNQLKFKKPQKTKVRKHQQIQYYTHRIQQNIHQVQNYLTISQYIKLEDVNYTLLKTQFNDSLYTHEILPGLEFQGEPNCEKTQVLCSSESFYKGVHGMVIKIVEKCKNLNTFLNIGIMYENVINTHYPKDGSFGAGVCVYTGTRPIQMQQVQGPEIIEAQTGDEIYTEINFDLQTYTIQNLRNGLVFQYYPIPNGFQIKQQMEENEHLRFRISFNGPNSSKIAVIKSF